MSAMVNLENYGQAERGLVNPRTALPAEKVLTESRQKQINFEFLAPNLSRSDKPTLSPGGSK